MTDAPSPLHRTATQWFSAQPGAARMPMDTFSFDGSLRPYLIGSCVMGGTTKLSKPEVKLLTSAGRPE